LTLFISFFFVKQKIVLIRSTRDTLTLLNIFSTYILNCATSDFLRFLVRLIWLVFCHLSKEKWSTHNNKTKNIIIMENVISQKLHESLENLINATYSRRNWIPNQWNHISFKIEDLIEITFSSPSSIASPPTATHLHPLYHNIYVVLVTFRRNEKWRMFVLCFLFKNWFYAHAHTHARI
jgi:hypothetical protein